MSEGSSDSHSTITTPIEFFTATRKMQAEMFFNETLITESIRQLYTSLDKSEKELYPESVRQRNEEKKRRKTEKKKKSKSEKPNKKVPKLKSKKYWMKEYKKVFLADCEYKKTEEMDWIDIGDSAGTQQHKTIAEALGMIGRSPENETFEDFKIDYLNAEIDPIHTEMSLGPVRDLTKKKETYGQMLDWTFFQNQDGVWNSGRREDSSNSLSPGEVPSGPSTSSANLQEAMRFETEPQFPPGIEKKSR